MTEKLRKIFLKPKVVKCIIRLGESDVVGKYNRKLELFQYRKNGNNYDTCIFMPKAFFKELLIEEL